MIGATLAGCLFVCGQAASAPSLGSWPRAMATSPIAAHSPLTARLRNAIATRGGAMPSPEPGALAPQAVAKPGSAPEGASTGGFGKSVVSAGLDAPPQITANPTDTPEMVAWLSAIGRKRQEERGVCLAMARNGDVRSAEARLTEDAVKDPTETYAVPLLDLELENGDYADAYKVAAAFIDAPFNSDDVRIRASLAAACMGQVFDGQREYCMRLICSGLPDVLRYLPKGNSPRDLKFLSQLELGMELLTPQETTKDSIRYLELAMATDPGNPFAARWLAQAYVCDGYQYSRAIDLLNSALPKTDKGYVQIIIESDLRRYTYDRHKVGDGHPPIIPKRQRPTRPQIQPSS